MKINEKIKQLRLDRGWSQTKLGSMLNPPVTYQTVQQIESGSFTPNFERLEDIARAFGLENKYLQECG